LFSRVQQAAGWENRFAMDVRTNITVRPDGAAALRAASCRSADAALHPAAHEGSIAHDLFGVVEIFKKTLNVADLKPVGRDVAKDSLQIAGISLLMTTLLDNGQLHGDCLP
jgi:dihydroxy-acid dehydratase